MECNKCVIHVQEIKRLQNRINNLRQDNCNLVDFIKFNKDNDDTDNIWFYSDHGDNFIDTLLDEVTVIISARHLKELRNELKKDNRLHCD